MTKLIVAQPIAEAERIEPEDDRPAVGSWWWVKGDGDDEERDEDERPKYDRGRGPEAQWLACVVEVGSNYAKLQGIYWSLRIALDDMPEKCTAESNPNAFIDAQISKHRDRVRSLMGEIKRVCNQLGVPFHHALAESAEGSSTALSVVHGTADVDAYSKALVKAKDKTLPELFAKVKKQHEHMATWMKAELIPAEAELARARGITEVIEQKIHTVELYAGLKEKLVQVREGDAAPADTKVHLMQRRCYMDEECLARYEAGGMDFEDIEAFDKWLARDENMTRILPHERCIVAFRIRRNNKDYKIGDSLAAFIKFQFHNDYNAYTFLYIRNGRQLWRMRTSIEFDYELFPRREDTEMLGDDELWVKPDGGRFDKFISGRQRADMIEHWHERRRVTAAKLWAWKRAGYPDEDTYWVCDPTQPCEKQLDPWKASDCHSWPDGVSYNLRECGRPYGSENISKDWQSYQLVTPENIYHDDAMKHIAKASFEHNRVAVIVQGLLDRSVCLHPHPPWRIWTPEGFAQGVELIYDVSLAITPGEMPSWEGYRAQLNKSIRVGAHVIGHRELFEEMVEGEKAGRRYYSWRDKWGRGPKDIEPVKAIRAGKAKFSWWRESMRGKWVPSKPGWKKKIYDQIEQEWWCPLSELTCIDAYTPGDFHIFFDDPRTRAQYLQWAPILLAAEDWHAERREAESTPTPEPKRKKKSTADHAADTIAIARGMVPLSDEDDNEPDDDDEGDD